MSEIHKSRNRIAGKKYPPADYLPALDKFIVDRINAGTYDIKVIAQQAIKDRGVISKRIPILAAAGKIKLTETKRIEKLPQLVEQRTYEEMDTSRFVVENPTVSKWVEDMKHRGPGGRPLKPLGQNLAFFKRVCDILKLNPSAFAVSPEVNEGLLRNLRDELRRINPELREAGWRSYTQSVRNFAMSHNVSWVRGAAPAIATGKKANYGAYSTIFANDAQREIILEESRTLSNPDVGMAIQVGHEVLCPRDESLRTLKVSQIHFRQRNGFEVAEFEVYESKTETTWPKQAFDPRIVRALKAHIATKTPSSYLFGNGDPISQEQLADGLLQCYAAAGIDVQSDGSEKLINYWKEKPIHVMRHTTGTMWMRRSGMNPILVAKQGWKTTDMVTQVYANMGLEEAWNANRCDVCKPDPNVTGDAMFCGWKCAVVGLNRSSN